MVSYKKKIRRYKIIIVFLLVILVFFSIQLYLLKFPEEVLLPLIVPETSVSEYTRIKDVQVDFLEDRGLITLISDCYDLTASVEIPQAISIQNGKEGKVGERPNSHDLAKDIFNLLGVRVLMVKITELRGNAYFSKIVIQQGKTLLNLDARPSDAIAIALRTNSPIYVKTNLLKTYGKYTC